MKILIQKGGTKFGHKGENKSRLIKGNAKDLKRRRQEYNEREMREKTYFWTIHPVRDQLIDSSINRQNNQ